MERETCNLHNNVWCALRVNQPFPLGSFVKILSKALLSMSYIGLTVIYCIILYTVHDGMIVIQEHINDYVTFLHKSYNVNHLSNTWIVVEKTRIVLHNMEVYKLLP